jgi:xylulokinase
MTTSLASEITMEGAVHRYVLAVDLGTSGCKVAVVSLSGRVESFAFEPVTTHFVGALGVEQDPADWWRALVAAAQRALSASPIARDRIEALACSCQGEGTVAVAVDGAPLARAMLWMDTRGQAAVRNLAGGFLPRVAGYDPFKLWRWIHLTGGAPALSGKDPAGHIAYLRESQPELFERTHKFLNVLDYMNFRLTGRFVATPDSALTTWVTDNRRLDAIRYDERLLRMSRIPRQKLPELVRCTDSLGSLTPGAARELGLPSSVQVIAGSVDNTAAALGSGAVQDGALHLYVGTSSWIAAHVSRKKTSLAHQVAAVPCAVPDRYLMTAMQSAAGANLSFLRDQLLFPPDQTTREGTAGDFYARVDALASQSPPGAKGLLYLPWLSGERTPVDDPSLRATLLDLSLEHSHADLLRAVLEGVALNTRWMLDAAQRFLGREAQELTLVGGGGQSHVWAQIFADVLGTKIRLPVDPIQVNVRGAAFLAGVGIGALQFDQIPSRVPLQRHFEPAAAHRELYAASYARFREAHASLRPYYQRGRAHRAGSA